MNGEEKEEANRPRPLSGGIWTLFSWLRRSERSSSSDSLSSVGSARTAVSFDFLSPGNCNITNTPIVLTKQLTPPTETYKKRLQERNLRRERDRDLTLHRKYGLFREYGSGYDGFSLPPARRTVGSAVNRQNRERRATSECLQRRAAYVPGKRRAPLPPVLLTSASLPRSYKRKRPAPKPPVRTIIEEKIDKEINNPGGMNSNLGSNGLLTPDNERFINGKNKKCDKKGTSPKDTKSKSDKSFLKHIFENKKRNSAIETSTVRLLPSISELDKQAAEIIENNKLLQNKNHLDNPSNASNSTAAYEGNSWFCTSCLRKYNSSVISCNYCLHEEKRPANILEKYSDKNYSPRTSMYTQTNINIETASRSQNNMDEQKLLKEILKEMKHSLPKKSKDKNIKVVTETETLRIGSSIPETYKDLTSQPSSSKEIPSNAKTKEYKINPATTPPNRLLSLSSILSEPHRNVGSIEKSHHSDENRISKTRPYDHLIKNDKKQEVTVSTENKSNPLKASVNFQEITLAEDQPKKKLPVENFHSTEFEKIQKTGNNKTAHDISSENSKESNENIRLKYSDNLKTESNNKKQLSPVLTKTNESIKNLVLSNIASNITDRRELFFTNNFHGNTSNMGKNLGSSDSNKTQQTPCNDKIPIRRIQNSPACNSVVINSVTVLTSNSNEKLRETHKDLGVSNTENHFTRPSTGVPQKTLNQTVRNSEKTEKTMINQTQANQTKSFEKSSNSVIPESNLHIPLKISSLLNPNYNPSLLAIKEDNNTKTDKIDQLHKNKPNTNDVKNKNINKTEKNKHITQKEVSQPNVIPSVENTSVSKSNNLIEPLEIKEVVRMDSLNINKTPAFTNEQKNFPSTSGCSSSVTLNASTNIDRLDQYDRRRHLINQLEQSIARGDEAAAADAAVKLAKLKLSCSVLSFSSQIVGESSKQNTSDKIVSITESQEEKQLVKNILQSSIVEVKNEELKEKETNNVLEQKMTPEKKITKTVVNNEPMKKLNIEPSSSTQIIPDNLIPINVWVEDKQAARGPIRLRIPRQATIADLRRQAELSLGLAAQLQRWIIGHTLCNDDSATIVSLAGPNLKAPFYLCLVQSDKADATEKEADNVEATGKNDTQGQNGDFYTELMKLEKQSLVPNIEPFECGVCMEECAAGAGVVLRECIHTFCRECLADVVQHCQEPAVACPAMGCSGFLQEREIRTIVTPEEHERWLARSLATAESGTRNTFHCRTRDCTGWAFCDPGVRRFPCPVCNHTNCVQCQAIHEGETCDQYQTKLRQAVTAVETNKDDEGTQALLASLISRGEALECPECKAIITKKWGCDWVKCSACKTEICWITKGRRWGPGGRGDTSAGCRCGVDGQRCHPSCGYCH